MIIDELHEFNLTTIEHYGHPDESDIVTGYAGTSHTSADAYYLGFIKYANLPGTCKTCTARMEYAVDEHTPDPADRVVIETVTAQENFPVGYGWYASNIEHTEHIYFPADVYDDISENFRFVNQMYPEFSCLTSRINIALYYLIFDSTGEHVVYPVQGQQSTTPPGVTMTINPRQLYRIVKYHSADDKFQITVFDGSANHNVEITAEQLYTLYDMDDNYPVLLVDVPDTSYKCRLFIGSFGFYNDDCMTYLNAGGNESTGYYKPFIRTRVEIDGESKTTYMYPFMNPPRITPLLSDYTPDRNPMTAIPCGGTGEMTRDQLTYIKNNSVYGISGNTLWWVYTSGSFSFGVFYLPTLSDIYKSMALEHRVSFDGGGINTTTHMATSSTNYVESYQLGKSYATDVKPTNEFVADLKTGDIDDPAFRDSLRPWQYERGTDGGIQSDDFTDDDVPGPGPGPGPTPRPDPEDPGDAENDGTDITLPSIAGLGGSFGFITQYAMSGPQIQELGAKLWSGFDRDDPDVDNYILNFQYNIDLNTGSVNFSDIMEFFVSFRAYPLPLINLTSLTAVGNNFYIGSGAEPIVFDTILHTADSYLEEIDAGSLTLPFWFGDYRDYSMEIALYLPYCGTAELNPGDVMGGTLTCTYVVDLTTGSCTAYVMCSTWDGRQYPVAIMPGQLGVDIPLTAGNAGRVGARLLGDRINVAENILNVVKNTASAIGAGVSGNYAGAARAGMAAFVDTGIAEQRQLAGMMERGAIGAPMLSGGRGLAAFKNPATAYVQVRSPFYAFPANYPDSVGLPSTSRVLIGSCSGFCQFTNVDVSGITADVGDQNAIRQALESGIIVDSV